MLKIIFIFSFITCFLLLYSILKFVSEKKSPISRLKKYIAVEEIHGQRRTGSSMKEYKPGLTFVARTIGNARFLQGYKKKIQFKLTAAHLPLKSEEFITLSIIAFAVMGLIGLIVLKSAVYGAAAAGIGWIVPQILLKSRIKSRIKHLNEQLSDAITLVSNSLKAGYSFFQAVDIVAGEMTGPIAEEFSLLKKEINLGLTTEKALENLVGRVESDDLELVVTAVLIQRQVGGNLSEILDSISSTIRDRVRIKGDVKTLTAQGRMSGLIISVLPPALGVILYIINPEYMSLLFKHPVGWGIVGFSIIMELVGIFAIKMVVKIEV